MGRRGRDLARSRHPTVPFPRWKRGPDTALRLGVVPHWAHTLEWEQRRREMTMLIRRLVVSTWILCSVGHARPLTAQDFTQESPAQRDARMAWWRDAQFGMFIHWGAYAVPAGTYNGERIPGIGEWIMSRGHIPIAEYEQFVRRFNPVQFDADEWVRIAKDAGMKYIIITSKHHDGFAIFDSKVSSYDIMDATPYRRDVIKALSEATHRAGLKFGVYYSIMDWHHPDAQGPNYPDYNSRSWRNPNFGRYVDTYMNPQLKELLTQYPYNDVLWFDGEWISDRGPDPPADRVAAARDGRLDAGEWRGHLRDEREPVRHAGVGPLHGQAGTAVCPHLRLAQGPAPTADRLERPTAARLHAGRRKATHDRERLGPRRTAPHRTTQHHRVGVGPRGWWRCWRCWRCWSCWPVRAAVLVDVGRIELRDVPCEEPGPRDVLVRVTAVGLCGTDFHIFAGHANYNYDERGQPIPLARAPQILGHEIAGVVEAAGASVRDLRPGERVVIDQGRNCVSAARSPVCEYCATGDSHQCESYREHGITGLPGGFAEYLTIPAVNAVRIQSDRDAAVTALTEPLGCVVHSAHA